ncbi:tetratricopeptide repeat protein [Thalassomonas sp. RHCl1]|uniref:tetratricopeptide repeat protein n=1 Tax=Thalassomonas sp. RHCl1 TaxID=2995320 RepID=UPI00248BF6FE|nr:tetratricopeptide repeat protein [Thalassomonas sp. RHCl1]
MMPAAKHLLLILALVGNLATARISFAFPEEVPGKLSRQEADIAKAPDSEKIPLILAFLFENVHYMQDKSLAYSHQALAILARNPNPDQESQIMSYLATANMYLGKTDLANKQVSRALTIANADNNQANKVLAYKVAGRILASLSASREALKQYELAYNIAQDIDDTRSLAGLFRLMAYEHRDLSQYGKSLEYNLRAQQLYQQLGDSKQVAHQVANIGTIYRQIGDLETALDHLLQALGVMQDLDDPRALAILYNNTARVYQSIGDYQQALHMYDQSLKLKQTLGYRRGIVFTLLNQGETYRLSGEIPQALSHLRQALELAKEINHPVREGIAALHLGQIYREQGNFDLAAQHFSTALAIFQEADIERRIAEVELARGKMKKMQGKNAAAIPHLQRSIDISVKTRANDTRLNAYQQLSGAYELLGKFQLALEANKNYQSLQKEISSQQSLQHIDVLRVSYQLDQKQRQIESLTQKNKISALEISSQIAKRNTYLIALFFVFSLLVFIYYRISARKQLAIERKALEEIRTSKKRLKLALWGSGNELWDWNLNNHQVTRINHLSDINLPGEYPENDLSTLKDVVHPDDYDLLVLSLEQYLTSHLGFFEACYRLKHKKGGWMWVLDRGKAVEFDSQGNPTRLTGTLRDISELKSHEQALIKLNTELELRVDERTTALRDANQALQGKIKELEALQITLVEVEKIASLGRLVSGIAHEINTPLGITITAVSVLKELTENFNTRFNSKTLTRSQMQHFIRDLQNSCQLIENNVARSSSLIQTFKQASVDKDGETAKTFDLQTCIESAFPPFKTELKRSRHTYVITCPQDIEMYSYPDCLVQVIEILIHNSIFHGFEDTTERKITIDLSEKADTVVIAYQDNGHGIRQENLKQLFEPFFTTKRYQNHTGLGLHIAYNQVSQRLGGNILYHSPAGHTGAGFTIKIPVNVGR